jgi:hypothetical protein
MATKRKPMGIHEQCCRLKHAFPGFRIREDRDKLVVEGELQPTDMGATYTVRIEYEIGSAPEVTLVSPLLRNRPDGRRPPHIYVGDKLCLNLPGAGEWTSLKALADTIVPWTAEWLFFYEIWHATGKWHGGGVAPEPKDPDRERVYHDRVWQQTFQKIKS